MQSFVSRELSNERRKTLDIPLCKPFRFVELISVLFSFVLLFFLRTFHPDEKDVIRPSVLLFFFTAIGSSLIVTSVDVILQLFRIPISNNPMILSTSLSCLSCFATAVTALIIDSLHEDDENHRILSVLRILTGICFFSSLAYVLDVIILTRYSCYTSNPLVMGK